MNPLNFKFYPEPALHAIDELAYSARDPDRYGDEGSWFLSWRMAINGVRSRLDGARQTYQVLTEWLPNLPMSNPEHELALCLFSMDSTLECWTFALNALGLGIAPSLFFDVRSERSLKRISPNCILSRPSKPPDPFAAVFPRVTHLWTSNAESLRILMDNHDVSKHRHANLSGWTSRMDAPQHLLKAIGMNSAQELGPFRAPMSQMLLPREPKLARINRSPDLAHWIDFVELKPIFDNVVDRTPVLAKADAEEYMGSHPPQRLPD